MKDPASRKSTWFWVGVTLISLSALFWLIVILTIVSEGDGEGVLFGVICTAIPVGIGIYGVVRGRESLEAATLTRERTHAEDLPFTKDAKAEIVIRAPTRFLVGGWFLLLLLGIPFILIGLELAGLIGWDLADKNLGGGLGLIGVGLFSVLLGIWLVGWTTKVTFNQPAGYIIVSQGAIPVFLWFLRTKRISREEAQSIRIVGGTQTHPYPVTAYGLHVGMKSGKKLTLFVWHGDEVEHLAQRILEFDPQIIRIPGARIG